MKRYVWGLVEGRMIEDRSGTPGGYVRYEDAEALRELLKEARREVPPGLAVRIDKALQPNAEKEADDAD